MVECDNCGAAIEHEAHNLGDGYYCSRACAIEHTAKRIIAEAHSTAQDEYNECAVMVPVNDIYEVD